MKLLTIFSTLLFISIIVFQETAFAGASSYSCSTDSKGKAIVLDSTKPGKSFLVAKIKAVLARKKQVLIVLRSATKSNKKLSKSKKAAKLTVIKTKLDDIKATMNLVKSCKNGLPSSVTPIPATTATPSSGSNTDIRTRIIVDSAQCDSDFNDCNFHGILNPRSNLNVCNLGRTLTVTFNQIATVGDNTTSTNPNLFTGSWTIKSDFHFGAGTYTISTSEVYAGQHKCLAAHVTYAIDSGGRSNLVEDIY